MSKSKYELSFLSSRDTLKFRCIHSPNKSQTARSMSGRERMIIMNLRRDIINKEACVLSTHNVLNILCERLDNDTSQAWRDRANNLREDYHLHVLNVECD